MSVSEFDTIFGEVLNDVASDLVGQAATYKQSGQANIACTVLLDILDGELVSNPNSEEVNVQKVVIFVLQSEVALPTLDSGFFDLTRLTVNELWAISGEPVLHGDGWWECPVTVQTRRRLGPEIKR